MELFDIAVIGSGPAGLSAGLYGARARAKTVVLDSGPAGGQIITTDWVENYPGFPEGISGVELGDLMVRQAERFGAEIRSLVRVEKLETEGADFVLTIKDGEKLQARTVIVATGAVPKKLGVPGEKEFTGRGVSTCATCDGALFRDREVGVVGGGDAALQEAIFLTKFVSKVHLIHRRDRLRGTECIQQDVFANEKIDLHWSRQVAEVVGEEGRVAGVRLASTKGESEEFLPLEALFVFIGVDAQSDLVADLVELDEEGFIVTDADSRTSVPGLYAAGDVTVSSLRQVVTAAAQGATAAFDAMQQIDYRVCRVRWDGYPQGS